VAANLITRICRRWADALGVTPSKYLSSDEAVARFLSRSNRWLHRAVADAERDSGSGDDATKVVDLRDSTVRMNSQTDVNLDHVDLYQNVQALGSGVVRDPNDVPHPRTQE
jgi:hypothetical protein